MLFYFVKTCWEIVFRLLACTIQKITKYWTVTTYQRDYYTIHQAYVDHFLSAMRQSFPNTYR